MTVFTSYHPIEDGRVTFTELDKLTISPRLVIKKTKHAIKMIANSDRMDILKQNT